ncbi:hypothetical protein EDB84DRAFT_1451926 [Lactarius hengduanensis]|nr:hypothetical protein EDB84DRAFT_1451926 [Lactarius hengduanensis]
MFFFVSSCFLHPCLAAVVAGSLAGSSNHLGLTRASTCKKCPPRCAPQILIPTTSPRKSMAATTLGHSRLLHHCHPVMAGPVASRDAPAAPSLQHLQEVPPLLYSSAFAHIQARSHHIHSSSHGSPPPPPLRYGMQNPS